MNQLLCGVAVLALGATAANAGGIDRSALPISTLFAEGNVAHLGFSSVTPSVSGTYLPAFGGGSTANMAESYTTLNFGIKMDLTPQIAAALFVNSPYGADAHYTKGAYTGLEAHWNSNEVAAVLKYSLSDRMSVYGGLRSVTSDATIFIPAALLRSPLNPAGSTYAAVASSDTQTGYLLGAAYEIPDIALRASLTYQSAVTHSFATTELFTPPGGAPANTSTEITLPQSVALDFQSGIAKDTLLFGSVKWSEWSKWHVDPPVYHGATGNEVTGFSNNVMSYQLGVGRKINDNLSLFARVGYEKADKQPASRLAPTDGMQSIGLGGSWTQGNMKITGGVEYVMLGNATDDAPTLTAFKDNHAMGVGVSVDFMF